MCRAVPAFRETYASARVDPFLGKLSALIEEHFRGRHSVEFYAEHFSLTPKALSAKVKRLTGKPLSHLVNDRVVADARRLLKNSDTPVMEIARHLGFEEPPHFSRFFKKAVGIPPTAFRLTGSAA